MQKGQFDLDDFASQLRQMRKMGGMSGILGMLPGVAKVKNQLAAANVDDRLLAKQEAMIMSMTPAERRRPEIIKASRKIRIAAGSGTTVAEINRLLKQFQEVQRMMKQVNKLGQKGFMRNMMPGLMPGGRPPGLPR
jgi:signal recognition particle subunit SRP54